MKILIVVPPSPMLTDDRVFPFLGPLQIASVARGLKHDVCVLDLTGFKKRNPKNVLPTIDDIIDEARVVLTHELSNYVPDIVGFHSSTPQHQIVRQLLHACRDVDARPTYLVGGPHANVSPQACLKDGFDYVVMSDQGGGGGEYSFLKALEYIETNKQVKPAIISAPSRAGLVWEHDHWPFPARDLIDLSSYHYSIKGHRSTSMVTMSGCPFACSYCSHWCGYRKAEGKSPLYVKQEINDIKRIDSSITGIMFYDDEINLRPGFKDEFLLALQESDIVWRAFFKSGRNLLDDKIFEKMYESGCLQLCTGAESADPEILKSLKKGITIEDNTMFVKKCVKFGIEPKVFTQVGLPGETHETVEKLRNWVIRMVDEGLQDLDVSITTPMPGSPIYECPDKYDICFDKHEIDSSLISYKSAPGENVSRVWNSNMSRQEIVNARQWIEDEFRKALNIREVKNATTTKDI